LNLTNATWRYNSADHLVLPLTGVLICVAADKGANLFSITTTTAV
jgi:hypothetical protein